MSTPTDIANQVIDAIGWPHELGDIEDGSHEARPILRAYSQCLRQLLRSVHWNFARQCAPLVLLADATGQTPNVGTQVITPWIYEYALPINCMKARFVPLNWQQVNPPVPAGNYTPANPNAPIVGGLGQPPLTGQRLIPARYLEATDPNYPPPAGSDDSVVQGVSPQGRTVILTNVQNAQLVFTALMIYPSNWDAQFRAAFVAYLAAEVALPIWTKKDRAFGLKVRAEQYAIAARKITQARATDGNEGFPNSDISVDWMRTRQISGGARGGWGGFGGDGGGPGYFLSGCDACCGVGNTSTY